MKIGILGGTFDPIHKGHLALANAALQQYNLEEIWFLPNGNPPHKTSVECHVTKQERLDMIARAIKDKKKFRLCTYEMDKEEVSYSYATMEVLKKRYPKIDFFFIVGADSLMDLPRWKHPERLMQSVTLLVACRDDTNQNSIQMLGKEMMQLFGGTILFLSGKKIKASSHEIRKWISEGSLEQAQTFLPPQVVEYIKEHRLYQGGA